MGMSVVANLTKGKYKDHNALFFEVDDAACTLVCPSTPQETRRWVWRAEFLGSFDVVDMALLEKGWHIAYCCLSDMFGCSASIEKMKVFHDVVVKEFGLNPKADLFGFSRGGLYSCNYVVKYPQDVSVLYLDAPVLDIKSWPFGFGKGNGNPHDAELWLELYGMTLAQARKFTGNPIDQLHDLLATQVPILLIAGGADDDVPYAENGKLLADAMDKTGYDALVIVKPDCKHHPHSLENPSLAVDFIEKH